MKWATGKAEPPSIFAPSTTITVRHFQSKPMKLASIQIITGIRPIEGADRIEAATVLGYQTVIKKGEFRPGDLCVWHEPDTVAAEKPEYEFLRNHGFRLKVSRFKGQVSQGLALPLDVLPAGTYAAGDD